MRQPDPVDPFFLDTFVLQEHQTPVFLERGRYVTRFGYRVDSAEAFVGAVSASLALSGLRNELRQIRQLVCALVWDDRGIVFGSNLEPGEEAKFTAVVDLGSTGQEITPRTRPFIGGAMSTRFGTG